MTWIDFAITSAYKARYPGAAFGLTRISGCRHLINPPGFDQHKRKLLRKMRKRETLAEAFTPYRLADGSFTDYGFGWAVKEDDTAKTVRHGGGQAGYLTWIERQLGKGNTIILLTNNGWGTPLGAIAGALGDILEGKEYRLPPKPISTELLDIINKESIDVALATYRELKRSHRDSYDFGETQLNDLGYHLLEHKRIAEAIEIFKLNVDAFPDESNTYDSLGEAYMANGDYRLAIENYEKALALNPESAHALEMLGILDQKLNQN